jgi:2-methylcitrate dehydratase
MERRDFLIGAGALTFAADLAPAQSNQRQKQDVGEPSKATPAPETTQTIEQRLVAFSTSVHYELLPKEAVQAVKRVLIDTFACAYGAIDAPPAVICETAFRKTFGGAPVASVIGGSEPLSTEGATLVNGVLVRYLDLNDVYVGKDPIHPSECIPSALACCEERGLSGERLIEAILVGYEAQLALVDAFSFAERGFHSLSCAGYAVPLLAGKAWNLTGEQTVNAMGIAGPRLFCLLAINSGAISMMKALPYGHDAMDSLFAVRLAAAGFTGASDSIAWFARHVKANGPDSPFTIGDGNFRIARVGLKRFPLQFELQTVAEAGVALHQQAAGRLSEIRAIKVETYPATIERTADPSRYRPTTKETADHSLPICLALALVDGDVTIPQFDSGRWRAPQILEVAQKVSTAVSQRLVAQEPNGAGAIVRLVFADGSYLQRAVEIAEGDPRRPMSRETLTHKFMQAAAPRLGSARAQRVVQLIGKLEELDDVSVLMKAARKA